MGRKCDCLCCRDQQKMRDDLNTNDGMKIIGEIDIDKGRCKVNINVADKKKKLNINISGIVDPNTHMEVFQKLCRMNPILSEESPTPSRMESTNYVLTFDGICCCDHHKKKVRDHLNTIDGVKIIGKIDIDNGRCKVTINIPSTVDPNTVEEEFQKFGRMNNFKLIKSPTPPLRELDAKEQIVRPPPPPKQIVPGRKRHGISNKALDESTSTREKTNICSHCKSEPKKITRNKPFTCDGCREVGFGSRYRCECGGYELHEECKDGHPIKTIELFKEQISLNFCSRPEGELRCNACGEGIHGCFYKSAELNLHPRCSSLKAEISVPNTNTDTIFQLFKEPSQIECLWCNSTGSRGWSYVSKCNKCRLHLCCVPKMVKYHWKASDHDAVVDISKTVFRDRG